MSRRFWSDKKILAVDDERHIVRLVQVWLERAGYEVVTAFSGKDALEKPDLVILDAVMPDMDGSEVLQSLRRNPATRELPVIMVNRSAANNDLFRDAEGRVQTYGRMSQTEYACIKPFNPTELISFVKRVFADQDSGEAYARVSPPSHDAPAQQVSWWMKAIRRLFS
jgi:DNA-binding response OmpR family regulator